MRIDCCLTGLRQAIDSFYLTAHKSGPRSEDSCQLSQAVQSALMAVFRIASSPYARSLYSIFLSCLCMTRALSRFPAQLDCKYRCARLDMCYVCPKLLVILNLQCQLPRLVLKNSFNPLTDGIWESLRGHSPQVRE